MKREHLILTELLLYLCGELKEEVEYSGMIFESILIEREHNSSTYSLSVRIVK